VLEPTSLRSVCAWVTQRNGICAPRDGTGGESIVALPVTALDTYQIFVGLLPRRERR